MGVLPVVSYQAFTREHQLVQTARHICGNKAGPRPSWEVKAQVRVGPNESNQHQTGLETTRQVHSGKTGPRSNKKVNQ